MIVAKFRMSRCTEVRQQQYVGSGQRGEHQYEITPGAQIEMLGVQSEPFGKATPYAKLEANILNPGAAQWFTDQWRQYVRDQDPKVTEPQMYVVFMTPIEYEAHFHDGADVTRSEREASQ